MSAWGHVGGNNGEMGIIMGHHMHIVDNALQRPLVHICKLVLSVAMFPCAFANDRTGGDSLPTGVLQLCGQQIQVFLSCTTQADPPQALVCFGAQAE